MNNLVKKSAVTRFKPVVDAGASKEETLEAILKDEKNFTEAEANEIYAAITGSAEPSQNGTQSSIAKPEEEKLVGPNDHLELSQFDYSQLKGKSYDAYKELEGKLDTERLYDFHLYRARPVKQERYPGVPKSPVDVIGLELLHTTPLNKTRVPAKIAADYNAQVQNTSKYYLLVKS